MAKITLKFDRNKSRPGEQRHETFADGRYIGETVFRSYNSAGISYDYTFEGTAGEPLEHLKVSAKSRMVYEIDLAEAVNANLHKFFD